MVVGHRLTGMGGKFCVRCSFLLKRKSVKANMAQKFSAFEINRTVRQKVTFCKKKLILFGKNSWKNALRPLNAENCVVQTWELLCWALFQWTLTYLCWLTRTWPWDFWHCWTKLTPEFYPRMEIWFDRKKILALSPTMEDLGWVSKRAKQASLAEHGYLYLWLKS